MLGPDTMSLKTETDRRHLARAIELAEQDLPRDDRAERWDRASVHAFEGTYGDYLLAKVGKVFPQLREAVL